MTAPALLEVSGLRKAYRVGDTNVQAVDGLSFTLGPGGSVGSWVSPGPARPPPRGCW